MMPVTVDPRWSFWLSIGLSIIGFLAGAGSQFADLGLSPGEVKAILAVCTLVLGVGNAVNAVLAAIPGKDPASGKFYINKIIPPSDKP